MTDPRVRELADLMVSRCLDVQPGWQVSVRASPLARPLVQEVARAIARRGAYYLPRINWDAEEQRMRKIKERLDRGREVRIVGEGTDLTLGIEGREGVVSAGFRNMPDGEVFYSPVEDTAEGVIAFAEFPAVYLGHDVVGARLVFRGGEVVEATADEGEEFLRQVLATDAGARRLGELGLGCNPRITRFTRNVLFDEKIDGTVHLAVGASYTYTGGRNESAVHWDLVKDLRPGGELYADGELVQRDGAWLI